jgi:hypothetical protein
MVAGIVEISKIEHEDRKFSYAKKLRSLLGLYMREFEHTKKLQQEAGNFGNAGVARSLFAQTFQAQANAAMAVPQTQPTSEPPTHQRQDGGWRNSKKGNKRQRNHYEPGHGQASIIKHS